MRLQTEVGPIWFDSTLVDTCDKGARSNGSKNHKYLMGLAATRAREFTGRPLAVPFTY